jgi:hypothetical protein
VTQNQQNHADVARLLTLLRAKAAANPGAMGPAPAFGTTQPAQADNVSRLLDQYGPNHPAVVAARREQARAVDQLKEQSAEHMRQLLVAVKIYDRVHKVLPPRLGQAELQNLLTMRVEENPRLPFLSAGYEWVGPEDPRFPRLADIKDPAHTPLIRETAPQPDGSLLVGYADGHVAEVTAEQLKADAH